MGYFSDPKSNAKSVAVSEFAAVIRVNLKLLRSGYVRTPALPHLRLVDLSYRRLLANTRCAARQTVQVQKIEEVS
jgi:hypothetical protein